ncbi:FemAB family PEP-CTERM system-associated protein [Azoarcus sp. TTM-91]|uniref:FemAB-related protein (PEP-CTERM system-associated) n=1 Tax=Azoarcus indigens TaxID=29545 RepID=A0A4R6E7A3_9RHOO|nr:MULTISPECIES: FemAB family XrtA/PEP-CTERM system-associated protein [Azoarcus]NMG33065.1 FemAB family PEP-CTERM system-associated protein [Azoarcus sp. TTM-91]NMG63910.1 FemAB family PEP-CTERM system-associated protein [Azoarcus indigens]TDN53815.1 FemAB-related protein (PEP-CTERM system-associated) [Azoarcus indigens]
MDRTPVVVKAFAAQDAARWDAFVHATAEATFFHLSAWRGIMEEVFRHRTYYLYAERAGAIVAVLPLAEVKSRLFGHALTSLPFCVYGGIVGDDEAAALLEAEAEALALRLGVQHLEYRNLTARHQDWPSQALYVTFRKEILPEVEANMLAIPRKQRAMVRKGIKNGLVATLDPDVDRFFALYSDNVLRHGTPALSVRFFRRLREVFGQACEVLTVTDAGGRSLSSVLGFRFRGEVLPYYAGDDVAARDLAANDFKYWELMRIACERGDHLFDYGRSKIGTGPWSFKKNWGFEPQPLSYEYRLYKRDGVPQNNPMNPKYRAFIALWRRLPLGVANALGPHIVRNLG